jgi:hypothetical protein
VQHLVVLEIVQQRRRREVRIAGEKNSGALCKMRRVLFQTADQRVERHLGATRLVVKQPRAASPGQDQEHDDRAEQHRHIGPFDELHRRRDKEEAIDQNQRQNHRQRRPDGPTP